MLFLQETVSIIIRFEGQSTEMDVLGENAVSEELNSLFLAQGISREEISLNYHESKENIHPNCKCGELKKSVIELSKMTKGSKLLICFISFLISF